MIMLLGWWWARRIIRPLTTVTDAMGQLDRDSLDLAELPDGNDEMGRLGRTFRQLAIDIQLKRQLEQSVISNERMAAIGRLTAGIAHEINNPLGGIFNALDTYRRHGRTIDLTSKTLDLIERGLNQIRNIVSALLVDVKPEDHALILKDLEDIKILLTTDPRYQQIAVDWQFNFNAPLPLPAARIRQILINLLLNAMTAAQPNGRVTCTVLAENRALMIQVDNSGQPIDTEVMPHLFEPFVSRNGTGLGLWVTYQIVQQLKGDIQAENRADGARFKVLLPFFDAGLEAT